MPTLRSLVRLSFISFFGLASLLIFVLISSSPIQEHLVVHSRINSLPKEFIVNGDADPDHTLKLTIHLASNNMSGLEDELYAVSDPNSPRYGQHLNKTEVDLFVRPSEDASTTLNKWLGDQGITPSSKSSSGNTVKIQVSVKQANKAFNTTFELFTHTPSNTTTVRAMGYSLPGQLVNQINGIYPITTLPKPAIVSSIGKRTTRSNATSRRDVDSECDFRITPACVQALYNIPGDTITQGATGGPGVGVLTFNNSVLGVGVAQFLQTNRPDIALSGVRVNIMSILGGDDPQPDSTVGQNNVDLEGNIDTQMVLGISPHTPITIYPNTGLGISDLFDTLNFLLDQNSIPSVITINYAFLESTEDNDVKLEKSVCNAIMQMGVQGVSILATSGDAIEICGSDRTSQFLPSFPSSCPFVTSVGSTSLSSGAEIGSTESDGGFSAVFPQPSYQTNAVNDYLAQIGSLNKGLFNVSGRGFPDIAAITGVIPSGIGVNSGFETTLSNAPIVAAIIADLNAQRQNQGKSSLGFLNPLLYSNSKAFNDITQGISQVCSTTAAGFPARPGWDAVTGLGSPNYPALQKII